MHLRVIFQVSYANKSELWNKTFYYKRYIIIILKASPLKSIEINGKSICRNVCSNTKELILKWTNRNNEECKEMISKNIT